MCASEICPLYDKKRNLLTSDKLEMCAILFEQFNSIFTTPLPHKQVIDPDVFFSVESIAYQDGIPCSILLNCAHELAPCLLILFKQSFLSGVIDPSLKKPAIALF